MALARIPVVDLAVPGDRAALDRACRDGGVFYVRASSQVAALEDRLLSLARSFFALPLDERMKVAVSKGGTTGYVPPDVGRHDVLFSVFPPVGGALPAELRIEPNKWPASPPGLAAAAEAYLRALYGLGLALVGAVAAAFGSPADALLALYAREPCGGVALRRYLAPAGQEAAAVLPAHRDPLPFTFIAQTPGEGLEAQLPSGEWISTPGVPGAVLCQLGEASARWTDDAYRPCMHRVHLMAQEDRFSLVTSMAPRLDAVIEALPGARSADRALRHAPITTLELLSQLAGRMKA